MTAVPKAQPRYKNIVEDCDIGVKDRVGLVEYRTKRDEWLQWYELREDEPHSIQQQVFSMIFLDMTYRILAEAYRTTNKDLKVPANGLLAHLLDQGYVATQVLAIRRLLDKRTDVISVRRLLEDISKHRRLLTRENYVCYDGLPYDPSSWQNVSPDVEIHIWGINAPGLEKYLGSQVRHETFDGLSGVSPSDRKRGDLIRESVLDDLRQELETSPAKKLINLSHRFLAHAADMNSRNSLVYSGVLFTDIQAVHRAIVRVERAITDKLLFIAVARDVVPMPPLGLLNGLDSPFVSATLLPGMEKRWEELADERNKWSRGI